MSSGDTASGVREQTAPVRAAVPVRAQVAEEFARYRAAVAQTAPFDACGGPTAEYYDEFVDPGGRVRPMWSELAATFTEQGPAGLVQVDGRVRRLIDDDGISYTEIGGTPPFNHPAKPSPWRLDPIPMLVAADDWARLETGLVQRSRVLDAVLTDLYGARRVPTRGLLPPQVVFGSNAYIRAAHGITVRGRHQLFLYACDISRWGDGEFRALTDWAQAPSGAGYALADRRVVSAAIPEAFEDSPPRPLTPFVRAMRLMLIEAAPAGADDDPVVVVLSPGAHSETAFDQAYLAAALGFPLVESADLVVRDGMLWMRSLGTLRRVDVVLRRVDAEFSDPLDLRPDSRLGAAGLVEVLRRGAVSVVNTLGSGILESPALACFLPRLCRELLGEELKLPGVPSYWGGDDVERAHLIAAVDRLVIRSAVDGSTLFGPALTAAERTELRARIEAQGWQWVGQEPPQFSVAPAVAGAGGLTAVPIGLRLFSMAGRVGYRVMPGGLGQLHQRLEPDRSVIKVAAKDVWVRAAPAEPAAVGPEPSHEQRVLPTAVAPMPEATSSPRVLDDLFWLGRYGERADQALRLLSATHIQYQEFRYQPQLEGADAVPVLISALARMTGTVPPRGPRPPEAPAQQSDSSGQRREQPGPDASASTTRAASAAPDGGSASATQRQAAGGGQQRSQGPDADLLPMDSVAAPLKTAAPEVDWTTPKGHEYLVMLTVNPYVPGSVAFALDRYGATARAVRDRLSMDTWMILSAADRALRSYRADARDQEAALSAVFAPVSAALLALSGIDAESAVRDTGWYVTDIGKRIERGLALTALLSSALTEARPGAVETMVTETVLRATGLSVNYRRRQRDSMRILSLASALLFDAAGPRSLVFQLDRLEADFRALPGASGSTRPQRLLADAQRMLRRGDPADLQLVDESGRRTELAELLDGVHLRLRKASESFEATRLSRPGDFQPLWGRVVQ